MKLSGSINEEDFEYINLHLFNIQTLDLSQVTISPDGKFPYHGIIGIKFISHLILPENLKGLEEEALAYYSYGNIEVIDIPESLEFIGKNAFSCPSLNALVVHTQEPLSWDIEYTNTGLFQGGYLYVPRGSKAKYESANGWKDFTNIIEYDDDWKSARIPLEINAKFNLLENGDIEIYARSSILNSTPGSIDDVDHGVVDIYVTKGENLVVAQPPQYDGGRGCTQRFSVKSNVSGKVTFKLQAEGNGKYNDPMPVYKTINISSPGDVNSDGEVNIDDVVRVVAYIIGTIGDNNEFYVEAADIDKDGEVLVNDLTAIVDIVLEADNAHSAPARTKGEHSVSVEMFGLSANDGILKVITATDMAAAQFDMLLPESAHLDGINLANGLTDNHMLSYRLLDGNRVRVVVYSLDNATIKSGELAELHISFDTDLSQQVSLTNALYDVIESDGRITEYPAADTWISVTPSGLGKITKDMRIYTDGGCIVIASDEAATVTLSNVLGAARSIFVGAGITRIPVQSGIYFINNQKLIIR